MLKSIDLRTDIRSLTEFKRNTAELSKHVKASRRPLVLTVNGKAELVVLDAASYQELVGQGPIEPTPHLGPAVVKKPDEQVANDDEGAVVDGSFAGFRGHAAGAAEIEVD